MGLRDRVLKDMNPLPYAENQQRTGHCIAFAVYHLLQMHANINASSRGKSSPSISLEYLRHVLRTLSKPDRTLENFLKALRANDVPSHGAFSKDLKNIRKGAKIDFAIDWTYGIDPNNLSREQLIDFMKHAIKYFGGVLVEFKTYSEADGKRKPTLVKMVGTKKATRQKKASKSSEETEEIKRVLGHVVVVYGWGPDGENNEDFFCLNSYGPNYGFEGCCTLKYMKVDFEDIHFVYVVQLRFL